LAPAAHRRILEEPEVGDRVGNRVVELVLRSPLHPLLSRAVVLVRYAGRRSGRMCTLPAMYVRDDDGVFVVAARAASKTWWRNFTSPRPAVLRLRGRDIPMTGTVLSEGPRRAEATAIYQKRWPKAAIAEDAVIVAFGSEAHPAAEVAGSDQERRSVLGGAGSGGGDSSALAHTHFRRPSKLSASDRSDLQSLHAGRGERR
jgi:hypothetical protein